MMRFQISFFIFLQASRYFVFLLSTNFDLSFHHDHTQSRVSYPVPKKVMTPLNALRCYDLLVIKAQFVLCPQYFQLKI